DHLAVGARRSRREQERVLETQATHGDGQIDRRHEAPLEEGGPISNGGLIRKGRVVVAPLISRGIEMETTSTITHWIGGKPYDRRPDRHGDVFNPATGDVQAQVALASPAVVDEAVSSATTAAQTWRTTSLARRSKILFAFREKVDRYKTDIAAILTREHGKVPSDALGEVQRGLEVIEFACGIPDLLKGEFSENVSTDVDVYSIRQPLGVVAGITPFNFPAMVPMWMYPIAIACGNTFILKPSERDPSASSFCAQLMKDAGLPDGVLNVV